MWGKRGAWGMRCNLLYGGCRGGQRGAKGHGMQRCRVLIDMVLIAASA